MKSFSLLRTASLCFICAVLSASTAFRATAQTTAVSPALYRVTGTVVDSATGEPVAHAAVSVLNPATHGAVASSVSDKDGHFALEGLPAAKYEFTAARRGYLTSFFEEHENYNSAIVTGPDQDTEHIIFRLSRSASLTVTVTGEGGEPVAGASVLLFRRVHSNGLGNRILPEGVFTTQDNGEVRIFNLHPGEFFVAVKAEPWFSMHGAKKQAANTKGQAVRRANPALDVVYPITWFAGVTDENTATPIRLGPGDREHVAFALQAVPALHFFVPLPAGKTPSGNPMPGEPDGDASTNTSSMQLTFFGHKLPQVGAETASGAVDGVEEYVGMVPGHYELVAGDPPRILEVDANTDRQIAGNSGTPAASLQADLRTTSGKELTGQPVLLLSGTDPAHPAAALSAVCGSAGCSLDSLPPGEWQLEMSMGDHYLPIVSVAGNGRTRSGNLLTAGDKPLQLTLTVADNSVAVEGFAKKGGKGQAGVMVVLVPRNPEQHRDLLRRDQSDSDGSFSLRDVAHGSYTVVAIEDGWNLEWQRTEVLSRFLAHGIEVSVPATPAASLPAPAQPLRLSAPVPVLRTDGEIAPPAQPPASSSPENPGGASLKQEGDRR